jgi:hypothetical protein
MSKPSADLRAQQGGFEGNGNASGVDGRVGTTATGEVLDGRDDIAVGRIEHDGDAESGQGRAPLR